MRKFQSKRVEKIIEMDRTGLSIGAEEIIKNDIVNLLSEYFALSKPPKISIYSNGKTIQINVESIAKSVKNFHLLK